MKEKKIKEKLVLKKGISRILNKILISIIIFLIGMIGVKKNPNLKKNMEKEIYEKNISFIKVKNIYKKYFGDIFVIEKEKKVEPVFDEKINYYDSKKYEDGVLLKVSKNTTIKALESGIIVFIGQKEKYGNTIILEQVNGIDTFYSNITNTSKKIYDYIEKGEIIGEAKDDKIILAFQKNGKFLDYQKYI